MILLYGSVIVFNFLAFKLVKRLSGNMILHIWIFTCCFQVFFDTFIDLKYHGYWFVSQEIDWSAFPGYTLLIPPVNLLFLNSFPFNTSVVKRIAYIAVWEVILLCYEFITLLPEPCTFPLRVVEPDSFSFNQSFICYRKSRTLPNHRINPTIRA